MSEILYKGLLLHISHYDPSWCDSKEKEEKFDLQTAFEIVDAISRHGMNILVVDCEDGVEYKSHPELKRHYTVPMDALGKLSKYASDRNIDIVPKLNFSKSGRNRHDLWLMPHVDQISWLQGLDKYFQIADDVISELVEVCRPRKFFHIGMDEDHYRSVPQYVAAIEKLRLVVARHGLRTVIWNDSCLNRIESIAQVHAEKSIAAEKLISKDIVHILWNYEKANPECVKRLSDAGFDVWAAPGTKMEKATEWRKALAGNNGTGLLMTNWEKCIPANKSSILNKISLSGAEY